MRILVTNDDGINSKGLYAVKEVLSDIGDIYIVAPKEEVSASSHSISLLRDIRVTKLEDKIFSVEGTPADCVNIAYYKIMQQQIDLVISGINKTPNLGQDVIYSGTVAAAAEACLHKIKACAISLVSNKKKPDFQQAAFFCKYLVLNIEKFFDLPFYTFLNINIPDFKGKKPAKDIAITTLGKRRYKEDIINEKSNTENNVYIYKFRSYGVINPNNEYQDGTDITAVYKEYKISITPLNLDFTDYKFIETFKNKIRSYEILAD